MAAKGELWELTFEYNVILATMQSSIDARAPRICVA